MCHGQPTEYAAECALPVLVVVQDGTDGDVYLGWIEDWSDVTRSFVSTFAEEAPNQDSAEDHEFVPVTHRRAAAREVLVRSRDSRFRFRVRQRYGVTCAQCDITEPSLVQAAHVVALRTADATIPATV